MNFFYFHVKKFTIRTHTHIQTATHTTNSTLKLVTNQTKHTSSLELSVRSGYNSIGFFRMFCRHFKLLKMLSQNNMGHSKSKFNTTGQQDWYNKNEMIMSDHLVSVWKLISIYQT